jgi:CxxC-x17-CxxC domain-containing protein
MIGHMVYKQDNRGGYDNRGGQGGSGGGRNYSSRGGYGNDQGAERQMFSTRCANCDRDCEVPFKPNGSKPVYCNECFKTMGQSENRSDDRGARRPYGNDRNDRGSSQGSYHEQFSALNTKLDKILQLLSPDAAPKQPKAPKAAVERVAPSVAPALAEPAMEDVMPPVAAEEAAPEAMDVAVENVAPVENPGSVEEMVAPKVSTDLQ